MTPTPFESVAHHLERSGVEALKRENSSLRHRLEMARKEADGLTREIEAYRSERDSLKAKLERAWKALENVALSANDSALLGVDFRNAVEAIARTALSSTNPESEGPETTHEGLKCPPGESAVGTAHTSNHGSQQGHGGGVVGSVLTETAAERTAGAGTGERAGREPSPMPDPWAGSCRGCGHGGQLHSDKKAGPYKCWVPVCYCRGFLLSPDALLETRKAHGCDNVCFATNHGLKTPESEEKKP